MKEKFLLNKLLITLLLTLIVMIPYCQFRTNTSFGGNYNNGNSGLLLTTLQSEIKFDSTTCVKANDCFGNAFILVA